MHKISGKTLIKDRPESMQNKLKVIRVIVIIASITTHTEPVKPRNTAI